MAALTARLLIEEQRIQNREEGTALVKKQKMKIQFKAMDLQVHNQSLFTDRKSLQFLQDRINSPRSDLLVHSKSVVFLAGL